MPVDNFLVGQVITTRLFHYLDRIIQQVVAVCEGEREQWLETRNSVRALRVRELLAGKTGDIDSATELIRYPLRRHHLALVVWYPDTGTDGDALARLQQFVRASAETAGAAASPLFVADDQLSGSAWLPYRSAASDAVADIRDFVAARRDAPRVAIGRIAPGISGFRRSHQLAQRETLQVFLRTGSSYKAAAARLDLHSKSVNYRVGRAVARRGRPITEDRLEIELALLVCHWYGAPVLRPATA